MKRKLTIYALMTVALFCFTELSPAQDFIKEFSLKVSGGYGTMSVGDLNDVLGNNVAYFDALLVMMKSVGIDGSRTGDVRKNRTRS